MFEIISVTIVVLGGVLILWLLPKLLPGNDRQLQNVKIILFVLYVLVILYETLLSRSISYHVNYKLSLFWSYRASLSFSNNGSGFGLTIVNRALLKQIILNILLYIPFGYLLPNAVPRLAMPPRAASRFRIVSMLRSIPWTAVLIGASFSAVIEMIQLLFRLGLFELDDIFNNTVGCFLGVILYRLLLRPNARKRNEP